MLRSFQRYRRTRKPLLGYPSWVRGNIFGEDIPTPFLGAPIRGYTSASQAQFYPRGLFRHSGNVLAFGDRTRINHGVEHRQPQWSAVLGIPIFAKVESLQNDASRFHDQG